MQSSNIQVGLPNPLFKRLVALCLKLNSKWLLLIYWRKNGFLSKSALSEGIVKQNCSELLG